MKAEQIDEEVEVEECYDDDDKVCWWWCLRSESDCLLFGVWLVVVAVPIAVVPLLLLFVWLAVLQLRSTIGFVRMALSKIEEEDCDCIEIADAIDRPFCRDKNYCDVDYCYAATAAVAAENGVDNEDDEDKGEFRLKSGGC